MRSSSEGLVGVFEETTGAGAETVGLFTVVALNAGRGAEGTGRGAAGVDLAAEYELVVGVLALIAEKVGRGADGGGGGIDVAGVTGALGFSSGHASLGVLGLAAEKAGRGAEGGGGGLEAAGAGGGAVFLSAPMSGLPIGV